MPTFYTEDLDIYVDKFLDTCNDREIEQVIKWLREEEYIYVDEFLDTCNDREIDQVIEWLREKEYISNYRTAETESINDSTFNDAVIKIQNHRISLSREEEEFILNIAKRF
jgi:hypothetical protein